MLPLERKKKKAVKKIPPLVLWLEIEKKIETAGRHIRSNVLKQNVKGGVRARRMLRDIRKQLEVLIRVMIETDKAITEERKANKEDK